MNILLTLTNRIHIELSKMFERNEILKNKEHIDNNRRAVNQFVNQIMELLLDPDIYTDEKLVNTINNINPMTTLGDCGLTSRQINQILEQFKKIDFKQIKQGDRFSNQRSGLNSESIGRKTMKVNLF